MICQDFRMPNGTFRSAMSFRLDDREEMKMLIDLAGVNYQYRHSKDEQAAVHEQFGFWENTAPNPNLFVDASASDIIPKPEDFVGVPFRLISATIVAPKTWRATDFSKPGVLKSSVNKLNNKPVYENHNATDLTNWVGIVNAPKWTEGFKQDGIDVPPGIDGIISIDAKTNPKLLRGVLSGIVFSNSVTVVFDWEPSHTMETPEKFSSLIGTMIDGTMVRRIVTKIHDYYESSLVFLGADPYAKLRDTDGNLVHIDKVAIMSNSALSAEPETVKNKYENEKYFEVSCGLDKNVLLLSRKSPLTAVESLHNNETMPPQVLEALRTLLNLSADAEITEADVARLSLTPAEPATVLLAASEWEANRPDAAIVAPDAEFFKTYQFVKRADVTALTTERDGLKTEKDSLTAQVKTLTDAAEAVLTEQRAEAIRLYRVAAGEKADEAVVELFNKADAPALKGLIAQYGAEVVGQFAATCKSCGGHEISFQSAQGGGADDTTDKFTAAPTDMDSIRARFITKNTRFLTNGRRAAN